MSADREHEAKVERPMHLLNAYTWAGRRGACAITGEFLRCTADVSYVTCPECIATTKAAQA